MNKQTRQPGKQFIKLIKTTNQETKNQKKTIVVVARLRSFTDRSADQHSQLFWQAGIIQMRHWNGKVGNGNSSFYTYQYVLRRRSYDDAYSSQLFLVCFLRFSVWWMLLGFCGWFAVWFFGCGWLSWSLLLDYRVGVFCCLSCWLLGFVVLVSRFVFVALSLILLALGWGLFLRKTR